MTAVNNKAEGLSGNGDYELKYDVLSAQLVNPELTVAEYLLLHSSLEKVEEVTLWLKPLNIYINGRASDSRALVQAGDKLSITLVNHFEQRVNTQWKMVWQNDEIMAIYKPAPLAVSRTTRNLYDTLISLVRRQTGHFKAQLLHRLDIETSGLILLSKDRASDIKWKRDLGQLIATKSYHAIVKGVPGWRQLDCQNQLAERHDSPIRCKMFVVDDSQPIAAYKKPKQSRTLFKVLKSQGEYSLIECQLLTGRKHQIRAQLAALGYPIIGDKIYSHQGHFFLKRLTSCNGLTESDYSILEAENHLLRAVKLELRLSPDTQLINLQIPSFDSDLRKALYLKSNH